MPKPKNNNPVYNCQLTLKPHDQAKDWWFGELRIKGSKEHIQVTLSPRDKYELDEQVKKDKKRKS